ncbi:hypothetical protein WG68_16885 [Arsukibacterium ikkense]|uniref:Peptidase n=1 Tax=Arsukibacterium ikkense TaxID=336831 RepID=A0A0M2V4Q4_9GAMM|nr:PepSY-associated TM helix domain-containing protein [Arsukibacterium ikkense]KKO44138.1 hypothetical protein WG68_16885 [Arsukibacterium ikkense]
MLWQNQAFHRVMRLLHSYSSMLVLVLLLFFAVTGITLNHTTFFSSTAGKYQHQQHYPLPAALQRNELPTEPEQLQALALAINEWLRKSHQLKGGQLQYELQPDEQALVLDVKRPAGYSNVWVDFAANTVEVDHYFAGYLALANDLHKGRDAGASWTLLIDMTAVACIIFALTGFYLMLRSMSQRSIGNSLALLGIILALLAYLISFH